MDMDSRHMGIALAMTVLAVSITCLISDSAVYALMGTGLAPSAHIGWQADKTTGGNLCTVASYDECQRSMQTSGAGAFNYPNSVAVDPRTGELYVAELSNARVQELTKTGAFVSMFGWDVNETRDRETTVAQAKRNVCTATSKDVCKAGVPGAGAGQLETPVSVAVDPLTGDIYVLEIETGDFRLEKYTREGRFLWRVGKGVNHTTRANLCTAREIEQAGVQCGPGASNASESVEHGAFKFSSQTGDLLAVGGPEDLLYVGDEHRVQVFRADGSWKREILLTSISAEPDSGVVALALAATGELYLVYRVGNGEPDLPPEHANIIHKFDPAGEQVSEYLVNARSPRALDSINSMALDHSGRLAVMGVELGVGASGRFGLLYDGATGGLLAGFTAPIDDAGIAFDAASELYVATAVDQEVALYTPAPPAEANGVWSGLFDQMVEQVQHGPSGTFVAQGDLAYHGYLWEL
jgi:hypothetical protein